jgi:23S rRNA pseudouridine2605 synthase
VTERSRIRINQFVASATGLSRRAADAAIAEGRITLAGRRATLGETLARDAEVLMDGRPLTPATTHTYIMFNKPAGYVSSRVRQGPSPTLYDLLPAEYHTLRTVGRLDRDSNGLILLSDDGDFIHRLTHPSFAKTKVYELTLARSLSPADQRKLGQGVELTDGPSLVQVDKTRGREVTVSLSEGRNRQLRRTFGALGYTVEQLKRIQMGPYRLGDLPSGAWVNLDTQESP